MPGPEKRIHQPSAFSQTVGVSPKGEETLSFLLGLHLVDWLSLDCRRQSGIQLCGLKHLTGREESDWHLLIRENMLFLGRRSCSAAGTN